MNASGIIYPDEKSITSDFVGGPVGKYVNYQSQSNFQTIPGSTMDEAHNSTMSESANAYSMGEFGEGYGNYNREIHLADEHKTFIVNNNFSDSNDFGIRKNIDRREVTNRINYQSDNNSLEEVVARMRKSTVTPSWKIPQNDYDKKSIDVKRYESTNVKRIDSRSYHTDISQKRESSGGFRSLYYENKAKAASSQSDKLPINNVKRNSTVIDNVNYTKNTKKTVANKVITNTKVKNNTYEEDFKKKDKSEGVLLSFMYIFEIFRWFTGSDVMVRFVLAAIAGIVGFGIIFTQIGLASKF